MRLATPASLTLMTASYFDEEEPDFTLTTKAITDSKPWSRIEIEGVETRTLKRVNARCTDLLEVCWPGYGSRPQIEFLHRTVRDFLETKDIQYLLDERAGDAFNVHRYMCNALLSQMKILPQQRGYCEAHTQLDFLVNDFMYHAYQIDISDGFTYRHLIKDLQSTVEFFYAKELPYYQRVWPSLFLDDGCQEGWMVCLGAYYSLYNYICDQGDRISSFTNAKSDLHYSPLSTALRLTVPGNTRWPENHTKFDLRIINVLLKKGANPNTACKVDPGDSIDKHESIWFAYLQNEAMKELTPESKRNSVAILEMLFRYGAQLNPNMDHKEVMFQFSVFCTPGERAYFEDLMILSAPAVQESRKASGTASGTASKIKRWLSRKRPSH